MGCYIYPLRIHGAGIFTQKFSYKNQLFMRRFWGFPLCYFFWGGGHVENMDYLHQAALFGRLVGNFWHLSHGICHAH